MDPETYRKEYAKTFRKGGVPFWPDGAWRDFVFGTGTDRLVIAAACAWSGRRRSTNRPIPASSRPTRARLVSALVFRRARADPRRLEGYVMILGPGDGGILLLVVPLLNNRGERAPSRRPWAIAVVLLSVITIGSLWIAGLRSPWSPNFDRAADAGNHRRQQRARLRRRATFQKRRASTVISSRATAGARSGPDAHGDELTKNDMTIRIVNGGVNMPAFGGC